MSTLVYAEHAAPQSVRRFVKCFWTLNGSGGTSTTEPVVSDGSVEIVIHTGDPTSERRNESAPLVVQPRACVIGPATKPPHLKLSRNVDVIGIRLHPWAGGALFGANAADFRDQTVGLGDLAKLNTDIVDRAGSAATLADRLGGITEMLLTFRRQTVDERVEHEHPTQTTQLVETSITYVKKQYPTT